MFVPAGPDVPIATPTLPVVRDQPSAMCVAPSSCRTMRCSMEPSDSIALYSGRIAAPGQPNTTSMPSDLWTSTTACMTGIFGMSGPSREVLDDLEQRGVVERPVTLRACRRDQRGDLVGDRQRDVGGARRVQCDAHVLVVQVDPEAPLELARDTP